MGYVKIWEQISMSSINECPIHVRWMWVIMLSQANRHGQVFGTTPALSRIANLSLKQTEDALTLLSSPDEASSTKNDDGRRIENIGCNVWQIINYQKYREMVDPDEKRETERARQQAFRRKRAGLPEEGGPCAYCGEPATGPDHVIPKSSGGTDVVLCCPRCNNHKARMAVVDFLNLNLDEFVDPSCVMDNPVLQRYVRFVDGRFLPVTAPVTAPVTPDTLLSPHVGEAEAEAEAKKKRVGAFAPPTVAQVQEYLNEIRETGFTAAKFVDYYQARGWTLKGGQGVKDWKACVRTWRSGNQDRRPQASVLPMPTVNPRVQFMAAEGARHEGHRLIGRWTTAYSRRETDLGFEAWASQQEAV